METTTGKQKISSIGNHVHEYIKPNLQIKIYKYFHTVLQIMQKLSDRNIEYEPITTYKTVLILIYSIIQLLIHFKDKIL